MVATATGATASASLSCKCTLEHGDTMSIEMEYADGGSIHDKVGKQMGYVCHTACGGRVIAGASAAGASEVVTKNELEVQLAAVRKWK